MVSKYVPVIVGIAFLEAVFLVLLVLTNSLVAGAAALVIGIGAMIYGLFAFSKMRLLENTPTSKVRSIAMGLVEVKGRCGKWNEALTAPFSRKSCFHYTYSVEKAYYDKNGKHWANLDRGGSAVPFYVTDSTGSVLVDSKGAGMDVPTTFFHNTLGGSAPTVKAYIDEKKSAETGIFGLFGKMKYDGELQFTEKALCENEEVYVLGYAGDNPYVEEASAAEGYKDVMIQQKRGTTFFITTKKEEQMIRTLGYGSFGILIGIALIIEGLVMLAIGMS